MTHHRRAYQNSIHPSRPHSRPPLRQPGSPRHLSAAHSTIKTARHLRAGSLPLFAGYVPICESLRTNPRGRPPAGRPMASAPFSHSRRTCAGGARARVSRAAVVSVARSAEPERRKAGHLQPPAAARAPLSPESQAAQYVDGRHYPRSPASARAGRRSGTCAPDARIRAITGRLPYRSTSPEEISHRLPDRRHPLDPPTGKRCRAILRSVA